MQPGELLLKLLKENNLKVYLAPQKIRKVDDGSLIIENPQLMVDWVVPPPPAPAPETPKESEVTVHGSEQQQ